MPNRPSVGVFDPIAKKEKETDRSYVWLRIELRNRAIQRLICNKRKSITYFRTEQNNGTHDEKANEDDDQK
jgi:hypothetical protein